jgi:hypothetical protein
MRVGPFEIDDTKVAKARKQFEAYAGYRCKDVTTFEQYLELFANDCNSFNQIGRNMPRGHRLSRMMVSLVYAKYFSDIFPHRPGGHPRQRLCFIKTTAISSRELPVEDCLLKEVAQEAVSNGLTFRRERIHTKDNTLLFKESVIIINSKRCLLALTTYITNPPNTKRGYCRCICNRKRLSEFDFFVILQKVSGYNRKFWIIPTPDILKCYSKEVLYLNLPIEKLPVYQNKLPKINWWQYKDAWHLLKKLPTAETSVSSPDHLHFQ